MQSEGSAAPHAVTFTDWMRVRFRGVLDRIGGFCLRLGISPNAMTLLGLLGSLLGAVSYTHLTLPTILLV